MFFEWFLAVVGSAALIALIAWAVVLSVRAYQNPSTEVTDGAEGEVIEALNPKGRVNVYEEVWRAKAAGAPIEAGTLVRVVRREGMILIVEAIPE